MSETLRVERLTGAALNAHIPALARLRMEVFRDYPYLYDGDPEYEARYLHRYMDSPGCVVVAVFDGEALVGASTGLPMALADPLFQGPLRDAGYAPRRVFYLGESVLLPAYRGRGLGVRFFAEREAHARALGGYTWAAFCAGERPADHPRRPPDYRPLDGFWRRRGYTRHPELVAYYHWRDLGEAEETDKPMVFWLKPLEPGA